MIENEKDLVCQLPPALVKTTEQAGEYTRAVALRIEAMLQAHGVVILGIHETNQIRVRGHMSIIHTACKSLLDDGTIMFRPANAHLSKKKRNQWKQQRESAA
jgi:hypothetical protein